LHPDGVHAGLKVTGVIEDQHSAGVTDRIDDIPAHVVTHRVGVPDRFTEQPLHRLRRRVPGLLHQLPTRPGIHIGEHQAETTGPADAAPAA
jgi:hypothetical protein